MNLRFFFSLKMKRLKSKLKEKKEIKNNDKVFKLFNIDIDDIIKLPIQNVCIFDNTLLSNGASNYFDKSTILRKKGFIFKTKTHLIFYFVFFGCTFKFFISFFFVNNSFFENEEFPLNIRFIFLWRLLIYLDTLKRNALIININDNIKSEILFYNKWISFYNGNKKLISNIVDIYMLSSASYKYIYNLMYTFSDFDFSFFLHSRFFYSFFIYDNIINIKIKECVDHILYFLLCVWQPFLGREIINDVPLIHRYFYDWELNVECEWWFIHKISIAIMQCLHCCALNLGVYGRFYFMLTHLNMSRLSSLLFGRFYYRRSDYWWKPLPYDVDIFGATVFAESREDNSEVF